MLFKTEQRFYFSARFPIQDSCPFPEDVPKPQPPSISPRTPKAAAGLGQSRNIRGFLPSPSRQTA